MKPDPVLVIEHPVGFAVFLAITLPSFAFSGKVSVIECEYSGSLGNSLIDLILILSSPKATTYKFESFSKSESYKV